MRRFIACLMVTMLVPAATRSEVDSLTATPTDTSGAGAQASPSQGTTDRVVVTYFHAQTRCATCRKLEAYSQEAVSTGFPSQLKDSLITWRVVNFEAEGNEHFAKTYGLYSPTLVLSRLQAGKEVAWKNLDKIWQLVGDKKEFSDYVQAELAAFLNPPEDQDG